MPRLDGLEVCRRAAQLTRVVIVTTFDDDEYVDTALARGAAGFILKDSGPALLRAAVRAAAHGDALISPELTVSLLERTRTRALRTGEPRGSTSMHHLTPRELDVARLVARGRTNAEVAEDLCISVGTVKTHLASVQRRLEARNRVEIASKVWASGLLG